MTETEKKKKRMIGIDIIRKKRKAEGSGSSAVNVTDNGISVSSGGDAQNAMHADEADHANRADEATHAASAKEIDGGSSVWNTIRTWINNATGALVDVFLRKDQDDATEHKLTMGAAEVKGVAKLDGGASIGDGAYSISKEGVARLAGLVAEYLQSKDFSAGTGVGFDGAGYGITKDAAGKYTLEIDKLVARMKMIVAELEVHEMTFIGGTVVMSSCGNRMARVEALDGEGSCIAAAYGTQPTLVIPEGKMAERFRCYFLASDGDRQIKNEWTVGQLARCKTNNIAKPGDYSNYENREYWRLVVGVSEAPVTIEGKDYHYIDVSNSTSKDITLTDESGTTRHVYLGGMCETMTSLPYAGDNVIGLGHCWDTDRQNVAILSILSLGWTLYKGISAYDLPKANIVNKFGIDEAIVTTDHLILRPYAAPSEMQTVAVVRGAYDDKANYGHNDMVTDDGQTWIASGVEIGKTITGQKPSVISPYWTLAAAKGIQGSIGPQGPQGEKGDSGEKGEKGDSYSVVFKLNDVRVDVLNFDDVNEMASATFEAGFFNQGMPVNVPKATMTCFDGEGNTLGSPIEIADASNIVADGGNLYLSKSCKTIAVVLFDSKGLTLGSASLGVIRNTVTYSLTRMKDTVAVIKPSDTSTNATFKLYYDLHYTAAKLVGTVSHNVAIATITGTIEDNDVVATVNGLEGALSGNGNTDYNANNSSSVPNSIPVTVKLSDGMVLYDTVPVTMQGGVAIDINNNLKQLSVTVADNQKNISTIDQKADRISLKVSNMSRVLTVISRQLDNSAEASYVGTKAQRMISSTSRGFTYFFYLGDNTQVTHDTYGSPSECDTMAQELHGKRGATGVLVILSYDATSMSQKLLDELEWWGLDPSMIGTWDPTRIAFAFIGEANLGRGRGWWAKASGASGVATTQTRISNGHVVPQYDGGDTAQKNALLATGIDMDAHTVKMTGQQFLWENNSGVKVAYLDDKGNAHFEGIINATGGNFTGTVTAATITGSTISGSTLQSSDGTNTTTIHGGSITTNNIAATGGNIGAWTIKDGGLTAEYGSKACIDMRDSKSSFRLDSDKTTNGGSLLSIYNYSGRVMSIVSEDSDESALYIRSNGNGRNLAISTFGNNSFLSRVREGTVINRLAYACVRTGDVNVDFEDLFVTKETGEYKYPGDVVITTNYNYEQTVKFPANPVLGVQLIVIQGTNKKVHFDGNGHRFQQGTDVSSSANSNQSGQWNLFIFDGQYWQCIYITGHLLW